MLEMDSSQVGRISNLVAQYISVQRQNFRPLGAELNSQQRCAMGGFFDLQVLDNVRVLTLQHIRIENPPFYEILLSMGFSNLPDFSQMAAITFSDVVVSHEPFTMGLLFHELVHVEQYRQLGIEHFAELYVSGFLTGGGYHGIPLEANAYGLGSQFEMNPDKQFSVADQVRKWVLQGRF